MGTKNSEGSSGPPPSAIASASRRWPGWLVFLALLAFSVNMGLAWSVTMSSTKAMRQQGFGANAEQSLEPSHIRVLEIGFSEKVVTSRQLVLVISMSMGFGMMAIGFALFVLGITSAYGITGETGPSAKLALTSSSPGLLCFLLSTVIMVVAMTRPMEVTLPGASSPSPLKRGASGDLKKVWDAQPPLLPETKTQ